MQPQMTHSSSQLVLVLPHPQDLGKEDAKCLLLQDSVKGLAHRAPTAPAGIHTADTRLARLTAHM